jgi:hypothetical protein
MHKAIQIQTKIYKYVNVLSLNTKTNTKHAITVTLKCFLISTLKSRVIG